MSIKLPQSHVLRQLLGAAGGMAAAGVVYFGVQTVSDTVSNRAMLVQDNPTISENADRVRVSDKNIDDQTLRRLQQRAQEVARLQSGMHAAGASQTSQPQVESSDNKSDEMFAKFTSTAFTLPEPVEQRERVQLRAERAAATQYGQSQVPAQESSGGTASETQLGVFGDRRADRLAAVVNGEPEAVADTTVHSGAQLQPAPTVLTNSGDGLQFIALLTIVLACAYRFRESITRLVARMAERV